MPRHAADRLEPEWAGPYRAWRKDRSPQATAALLDTVHPAIQKGIRIHVGRADPLIHSRARQLTLKAFETYDPSQATLGTHIVHQLQGLKRYARQQRQILRTPERLALNRGHVLAAEEELRESLGREPSLVELADHTGLSIGRLQKVRRYHLPLPEGALSGRGEEDEEDFSPGVLGRDPSQALWGLVYHDAAGVDQKILEHALGLHGSPQLSNQEIASRVRLSPGAVSQRKAALQRQFDELASQEIMP